MQCREQEQAAKDKEREFRKKVNEVQDRYKKAMKDQRHDHEKNVVELKNQIKSSQIALDMERNQMSAQEEMLHDMIHTISMEFASFQQKNQMVRPSIEARVTAKHKKEKEQESFYINPSQLAGGGP